MGAFFVDDRIHVAIRSYKRAGKVTTLALVPEASVWVPESQGAAYREHYGDLVVTIPDAADGNLARKNNAILDRTPREWTLILDDDVTRIGMWEGGKHSWLGPEHVGWLVNSGFDLAERLGVKLWGLNQHQDPASYDVFRPYNLLAPVLGPFEGHLAPSLRYDETVLGKDDYDFWLQNLHWHRKTLRLNKYHYVHDLGGSLGQGGGFVSQRSREIEEKGLARLREKWGSRVVTMGGAAGKKCSTGANILNTMIRHSVPGC